MPIRLALILIFALSPFAIAAERPNILFAISDDQSFPHASAYGCRFVRTPAFDRVAQKGVLFTNAFAASPGCSPCRAAVLTGRHIWQLEQAGTHASSFPLKYQTFPEALEEHGYWVGLTGKGWGPGNFQIDGRKRNPAGPAFRGRSRESVPGSVSRNDYAGAFEEFLSQKPDGQPFCFWYGAAEPHRPYAEGSGVKAGKRLEDVEVPPFLPDCPEIRADLLDYALEIESFDAHLGRMLDHLDSLGELENTLVIVTSDNGLAFPRAKANCYEFGLHMPLAICWGARVPAGRTNSDLVGFVDLTATIREAAGLSPDPGAAGRSLMNLLTSHEEGRLNETRREVLAGRERHSSSRPGNLGYPQRALRTSEYLYVWNCHPERWPAGDPQSLNANGEPGPPHGGYHDIDASPTLSFLVQHRNDPEIARYFHLAVDHRPEVELYHIKNDPGCLHNLAGTPAAASIEEELGGRLKEALRRTEDPRIVADGEIFETYPRYSPLRSFPEP